MSKSSTATAPKNPSQPPPTSAWARGPPPSTPTSSSRSGSPAPTTPVNPTHSRRASNLGQGVSVKDGVSVPRGNVDAVKQSPLVNFGSINDVSAPISSSPASAPTIKSEGVKSFGTLPATSGHTNGKPSISGSIPSSKSSSNLTQASSTPSSTPPAPSPAPPTPKINKSDITKLFQHPSSLPTQSSDTPPDAASPANRQSSLPPPQPPPTSQPQQGPMYVPPSQAASQFGTNTYPSFVPGGLRPQQNPGPGGGPPRSPVFSRPVPNGHNARPSGGPNGPGGGVHPQLPAGMSSPRLNPHQLPQPAPGMPQPHWGYGYYPGEGYPYYHMVVPQYSHHPHSQHQPHSMPPHSGMPMSPRAPPPPLQGVPSTPTLPHAQPVPHPNLPHPSSTGVSGLPSTPPTPSIPHQRLNTNASAFVPSSAKVVVIKNPDDGQVVSLSQFNKPTGVGAGAAAPNSPGPTAGGFQQRMPNRSSIRMESEEAKKKRIEEEAAKAKEREMIEKAKKDALEKTKREAEEKGRKEEEEKRRKKEEEEMEKERIRKEKEEEEERERERIRLEEEEKEKKRKAEAEEEEARARKAEEERKIKEEEAQRLEEDARQLKEEQERLEREAAEEERLRREAEEAEKDEELEVEDPEQAETELLEEGEIEQDLGDLPAEVSDVQDKTKEKENLRIDTTAPPQTPPEFPRRRPDPLDLKRTYSSRVSPALPSALTTARAIDDLSNVPYPEGVMSPKVELNIHSKDGKFRYDREFLLQFMEICHEKPDMLPPLDAIGLEPADQGHPPSRGGLGRNRQTSGAAPPGPRGSQVGLSVGPGSAFGAKVGSISSFNMGNFQTAQKLSSDERFAISNRSISTSGVPTNIQQFRPSPMVRTASQGGGGSLTGRTRSKRGEKRDRDASKAGPSGFQQGHIPSPFGAPGTQVGTGVEAVVPLAQSANAWAPASVKRTQALDADSPEMVDRKVKGLLNRLTMERFDSISDQIIAWANKSEKEKNGRTLIQVIRLVFEKATDEAPWSEMYARLCRKMMEQLSPKVQDDGIKNSEGKPITGGQLFRKYLLNRCQEDFERGWFAKETTAAAAATKAIEDQAVKAAHEKAGDDDVEVALYSEEYYAAQKAKRQGLGLIKFIGELFKLQMLTERIMHECVKKLLGNVENPEEEEIESLCKLLSTVGAILDHNAKAVGYMDVYFSRMKELTRSPNVSARMQFMLQDVIELRERKWVSRNAVAAPSTIAQVHEAAAKEKAAQEKEAYQRQMSMSRGGSRRGVDRGSDFQQSDGWAVAGGSGPRPPPKVGDLTQFGKINKNTAMTFTPASIFGGKKEAKRESSSALSRSSSNSNMFHMLGSQSSEAGEAPAPKSSQPPSRKPSGDFTQSGLPEAPPQRRKLLLLPRTKPAQEETSAATPTSEGGSEDETAVETMSEEEASRKISEDLKEFFGIRKLDEAESYWTSITSEHQFRLVEKLVASAVESKEADAHLVADFFSDAAAKSLCPPDVFEEGFGRVAEILDDIAIDAPKAFSLMAIMVKGSGLDAERRERVAEKLPDPAKLLDLLS